MSINRAGSSEFAFGRSKSLFFFLNYETIKKTTQKFLICLVANKNFFPIKINDCTFSTNRLAHHLKFPSMINNIG